LHSSLLSFEGMNVPSSLLLENWIAKRNEAEGSSCELHLLARDG